MTIFVYAYDLQLLEHIHGAISSQIEAVYFDTIFGLEVCSTATVIVALGNDVRQNDLLITSLVCRDNRILVLQRIPVLAAARHYLSLGVKGYGNAMMQSVYFAAAIETIESRMIWLHPELTAQLVEGMVPSNNGGDFLSLLSGREQEISLLLLKGKTNNEIAELVGITPRTIKAHATHIYQKLQVKDRLDFALRYK
ncbi:MAG: LuxR C-terminal-related transcriptional regulator [Sulfuricurvum sp.]|nr:LuxR C-terminal-related transcriptional regulator [Sulfuricurvum sp.]